MNVRKEHWDSVYETKQPHEVSWTQEVPKMSLDFVNSFSVPKSASIIDIGGGDSRLVDFLIEEGYENITVLDISAKALERTKTRLGNKSDKVNWIVSDITEFSPKTKYDVWHDRATFHFLTTDEQIEKYQQIVDTAVEGYLILGTFSENGPKKCSGLEIKQYSEKELESTFQSKFEKIKCIAEEHTTPFETTQNFLFCSFKRNKS